MMQTTVRNGRHAIDNNILLSKLSAVASWHNLDQRWYFESKAFFLDSSA